MAQPPVPPQPQWQNIFTQQIFMNSGATRFLEEINATNSAMRQVLQTQRQLSTQAANLNILPSSALNDFNNVQERIHQVQEAILEIQNIPLHLRTDSMNNQLEVIREQMSRIGEVQNHVSGSLGTMNTQGANASLQQLNNMLENVTRHIRDINSQQIRPQWQSVAGPPVFQNTGAERFQAEIVAANNAMQRMLQVQAQVRASTASMRMLPASAQQDIANIGNRMTQLEQKIRQINRIPVSMRTDALNNQLENLRGQFFQATQSAEALNRAMQQADLSEANAAAQQLNAILDTAERNIRDNINMQDNFNQSVEQGTVAAGGLESMIKQCGEWVKKVLGLSDILTQSNARIAMMAGGMDKVGAVQDQVFAAAQRARGNYQEMMEMIYSFGVRAQAVFSNTNQIIKFAENLNKMYAIAGATQEKATEATLQLTQALESGVLGGQELNSIFKAAPNLIQTIADYLQVDIEKIKEMAENGKLSARVVKNAVLSASADIDKQFSQMPTTFTQVANSIKNQALMAFQPVLTQISDITKSDRFQSMVTGIVNGLVSVGSMATQVFNVLATGAAFVVDNWDTLKFVFYGVAAALGAYALATGVATIATKLFNKTLWANPLTWIIIAIGILVAVLYSAVAAINKVTGDSISATGLITGTLSVALAVIKNTIFGAIKLVFGMIEAVVNPMIALANFVENLFNDPIGSIIHLFADMADAVLGIIEKLASAIDMVFGTSLASHVAGWRDSLASIADEWANKLGNGTYEATYDTLNMDDLTAKIGLDLQRTAYGDAWNTGYDWGAGFSAIDSGALFGAGSDAGMQYINDGLLMQGNYNTAAIADSTRDITDSLEISNEELKYMKDMAERDYINRFTTAENKVEVGNISIVANEAQDLDGMVDYLTQQLSEQMAMSASGYHNY